MIIKSRIAVVPVHTPECIRHTRNAVLVGSELLIQETRSAPSFSPSLFNSPRPDQTDSPIMSLFDRRGVLLALLLASSVSAHGDHHSLPEGTAITEDPIVCVPQGSVLSTSLVSIGRLTLPAIGCDIMGAYDSHGLRLWGYLPFWYDSWGMCCSFVLFTKSQSND